MGTLVLPEGDGPWPLVVVFPDAGGPRVTFVRTGERLAGAGYAALVVDAFRRQRPFAPFDIGTVMGDPPERARLMGIMQAVKPEGVITDTVALVDAITDARVRKEVFGTMGYCFGGRLSFLAAISLPERVVAAASIHGGGLVSDAPDSLHRRAAAIRASVYLGVAGQDSSCTPEHQGALAQALGAAGVRYLMELNADVRHGYAVPDLDSYDEVATEHHWGRLLELFGTPRLHGKG
ncbi:MAG: dienelactone hydrolase family protein [Myxococcales bacterium]|nr:MAG: dienelactone hydrolase family protein [Myxococcales bacterium]